MALFAILFVWQFPHFMAIAWLYREGLRTCRDTHVAGGSAGWLGPQWPQALFFSPIVMIRVSLSPWALGLTGLAYAIPATLLGLFYLAYTVRLCPYSARDHRDREPHGGARPAQSDRALPAPVVYDIDALCQCKTVRKRNHDHRDCPLIQHPAPAIAAILAISAAATAFLFWLIYVHPAADAASVRFAFPAGAQTRC